MIAERTRKIAARLVVLVLFLGVATTVGSEGEPGHHIVSMVHLLSRPSDFDGKIVFVRGYLKTGFGARLYLTNDHAKISDTASSIPVEVPAPELMECADAFVAVDGWFGLRDGEYQIVKTLEISRWVDPQSRTVDKAWVSTCWKREGEE